MKKLFSKLIIANLACILMSGAVFAEPLWHRAKIKWVYPLSDGNFVLTFYTDHTGCTNPGEPKYHYVKVGENGINLEASNKIFSAALTAASAGKFVNINFDDSTEKCYINRLSIEF